MNAGIDHATCIATARTSRSRAVRAHYLNLAAFWRLAMMHGTRRWPEPNDLALLAATSAFTPVRDITAHLPA